MKVPSQKKNGERHFHRQRHFYIAKHSVDKNAAQEGRKGTFFDENLIFRETTLCFKVEK